MQSGRLQAPDCNLSAVFQLAKKLADQYAADLGVRSLDILHIAAAQEIGCDQFVTFDQRQRRMADADGFR